jgi:hypothetical protein
LSLLQKLEISNLTRTTRGLHEATTREKLFISCISSPSLMRSNFSLYMAVRSCGHRTSRVVQPRRRTTFTTFLSRPLLCHNLSWRFPIYRPAFLSQLRPLTTDIAANGICMMTAEKESAAFPEGCLFPSWPPSIHVRNYLLPFLHLDPRVRSARFRFPSAFTPLLDFLFVIVLSLFILDTQIFSRCDTR